MTTVPAATFPPSHRRRQWQSVDRASGVPGPRHDDLPARGREVPSGAQSLTIHGNGATLDGAEHAVGRPGVPRHPAAVTWACPKLTVRNTPAEGIAVEVPAAATGTLLVTLTEVAIMDNRGTRRAGERPGGSDDRGRGVSR